MAVVFEVLPSGADEALVVANASVYDTLVGNVRYDTAHTFKELTSSIRFTAPNTITTAEQEFGSSITTRYITRVWRCGPLTGSAGFYTLLRGRLGGATTTIELRRNTAGQIVVRLDGATVGTSAALADSVPFRLEADLVGTSATVRLYSDAESITASQTLGPYTYSGAAFDRLVDGVGTVNATATIHLLYAADGDTSNPSVSRWSSPAPAVNAGTDQTGVEPYATVTLAATSSEASVSWSQLTGTAVTLSGSGLSRTFTAPGTLAGETLTFRATASNGGGSSTDDVAVTVLPVTERAAIGGVLVPMRIVAA